MGNCLRTTKVSSKGDNEGLLGEIGDANSLTLLKVPEKVWVLKRENRKIVGRFQSEGNASVDSAGHVSSKDSVVRVRIMVRTKELSEILSCNKDLRHPSFEKLLDVLKMSRRILSEEPKSHGCGSVGGWRPALESIPEDH